MSENTQHSQHQNADKKELDNFNRLSHKWWDEEGEFGALHKINPLRLQFMHSHKGLKEQSILDIGCGGGILSESMARIGAQVTGIDLAEQVLQIAKLHALDADIKVNYQLISAEDYAMQNSNKHDIVTCMEMLEHVPDPQAIVSAASDACKSGGLVFLSTLNRNLKSQLLAVYAAENFLNLVPKGTHQHDKFIKPSEMAAMARKAGLAFIDSAGIEFNPLLQRYGLNNDLSINYLMAFRKPESL